MPRVSLPEVDDPTEVPDGVGVDVVRLAAGEAGVKSPEYTVIESRSMNGASGEGESGARLNVCLPGPRPFR